MTNSASLLLLLDWVLMDGGAQNSTLSLLQGIKQFDQDVKLHLVSPDGELSRAYSPIMSTTWSTGSRKWALEPTSILRAARATYRAIDTVEPDLIHTNSPTAVFAATIARLLARRSLPIVYHYRAVGGARTRGRLAISLAANLSNLILTPTSAGAADIATTRRLQIKTRVIPNPVALPLAPTTSARNRPPYRIGVVARCEAYKGIDVALDAFEKLLTQGWRSELRIVTNTSANSKFTQMVTERAVPLGVELLQPPQNINAFMASCDLIWVPSRNEAFGRVAVEALMNGRPVIATNVGGLPAVVPHPHWLVDSEAPDQLAHTTISLFASPDKLREDVHLARKSLISYSPESVARQTWHVFEEKLGKTPRPGAL